MKRTVGDIKKLIGNKNCRVIGDDQRGVCGVRPIHKALAGDLTFCVKKGEEAISLLEETKASVVIYLFIPSCGQKMFIRENLS
jgi:hypothetical protein